MSNGLSEIFIDTKTTTANGSYQEVGLTGKALSSDTNCSASTLYSFKIDAVEYTFTTSSDATQTYQMVIDQMNAEVINLGFEFVLTGGDLCCISAATPIDLTVGVTGTDVFTTMNGGAPTFDTAVPNILYARIAVPGRRAILKQIRINFPIIFTGDAEWTLDKITGNEYDQKFTDAVSAATSYYKTSLELYCGANDWILITTSAACLGVSYVELTFLGSGI